MAGYIKDREKNYEIKYLRKVLRQVDDRIQVPESVSADSLRHLLDNIEAPSVREVTPRRPRWLSLQSGVAYAAAFALIVALFYSTRLYRPAVITGGMDIEQSEAAAPDTLLFADAPDDTVDDANEAEAAAQAPAAAMLETQEAPVPDPVAEAPATFSEDIPNDSQAPSPKLGVGGSGKANLLLTREEYSFYWRENDANDPDRTSPISFEVVNIDTQETVTQTDVPLASVAQGFELDGSLVFIGTDLEGEVALYSYDVSAPEEPLVRNIIAQDGELVDAKVYNDVVRIVSISESGDSDMETELLPNCISSETCVITAFDPKTQNVVTKQFTGANGTIQLHSLNAYIRYTGQNDEGESRDYIAQILFDGTDITLGTVS